MDKGDGSVRYVLTGDGAGTLFLIDDKSGDIHATKKLDREEKAMYTLNAKVLDRITNAELEPDTEFNIKIHDINDNAPKFAKEIFFASVPEMSDVGELQPNPSDGCLFVSQSGVRFRVLLKRRKQIEQLLYLGALSPQCDVFVRLIRHSAQRKLFGI